jgi:hypothetical protein
MKYETACSGCMRPDSRFVLVLMFYPPRETLYTNFVFQYAASEDRIRALWDKTRYLDERRIVSEEEALHLTRQ